MAKAFYKKAQIAYENNEYKKAIDLLEKTKSNLNGGTNPDIIYLEAKSRLANDKKINHAKTLFETFLNTVDDTDSRVEEVSSLLVDFETSDEYYSNGQKKRNISYTEEGLRKVRYYASNGIDYRFDDFDGNELVYSEYYSYINGEYRVKCVLNLKDREDYYYSYSMTNGDVKTLKLYNSKPSNISYQTYGFNADYEAVTSEVPIVKDNPDKVKWYYDGELRQEINYNTNTNEIFSAIFQYETENNDTSYLGDRIKTDFTTDSDRKLSVERYHDNGLIAVFYFQNFFKASYAFDYRCYFDEIGNPLKMVILKKGRHKRSYSYDSSSKFWTKI
ncbi:hypothetical protein KH5_23550 [Urechidicola sp. KH5]